MKKSYIKFFIITAIILLFLYLIYSALTQKSSPASPDTSTNTLILPAQNQGTVQVKDFTKSPQQVLEGTDVIIQNDNYSIVYFTKDKSLLITILAEPLEQNRYEAEQEMLSKLNITQGDACKLTVALTVPAGVSASLAGENFGLSFCQNGKPF